MAGLDVRLGWSSRILFVARFSGLILGRLGLASSVWTMGLMGFLLNVLPVEDTSRRTVNSAGRCEFPRRTDYSAAVA